MPSSSDVANRPAENPRIIIPHPKPPAGTNPSSAHFLSRSEWKTREYLPAPDFRKRSAAAVSFQAARMASEAAASRPHPGHCKPAPCELFLIPGMCVASRSKTREHLPPPFLFPLPHDLGMNERGSLVRPCTAERTGLRSAVLRLKTKTREYLPPDLDGIDRPRASSNGSG